MAEIIFEEFVAAKSFKSTLLAYEKLKSILKSDCKHENLDFYNLVHDSVVFWRSKSIYQHLDKRISKPIYKSGHALTNTKVLIIGAGTVGLRTAIECALLGARVVVVEKRQIFSRNNVLLIWRYVAEDLISLGAKAFFGKFCVGSRNHISIRMLQLILLKMALLLGVTVQPGVAFSQAFCSSGGWCAKFSFLNDVTNETRNFLNSFNFNVLFGAEGLHSSLHLFKRKEIRAPLAIAITANFINQNTSRDNKPEELNISYVYHQDFFLGLKENYGIDLENIVYFRDCTHYFVMTAKKCSLLERGVLLCDNPDSQRLLSSDNIDYEQLLQYAFDAANFATGEQLDLKFATDNLGGSDIAMFDFTCFYKADHACRFLNCGEHTLLMTLVGDSLFQPFWPSGTGLGKGFLGAFDSVWAMLCYFGFNKDQQSVLAERDSLYKMLSDITPNHLKPWSKTFGLPPESRYGFFKRTIPESISELIVEVPSSDVPYNIPQESPKNRRHLSDLGFSISNIENSQVRLSALNKIMDIVKNENRENNDENSNVNVRELKAVFEKSKTRERASSNAPSEEIIPAQNFDEIRKNIARAFRGEKSTLEKPVPIRKKCYFCKTIVFELESYSAEGKVFHRCCFRCEYCDELLNLSCYNYAMEDNFSAFYCPVHFDQWLKGELPSRISVDHPDLFNDTRIFTEEFTMKNSDALFYAMAPRSLTEEEMSEINLSICSELDDTSMDSNSDDEVVSTEFLPDYF